jgi:hypothetical protein
MDYWGNWEKLQRQQVRLPGGILVSFWFGLVGWLVQNVLFLRAYLGADQFGLPSKAAQSL